MYMYHFLIWSAHNFWSFKRIYWNKEKKIIAATENIFYISFYQLQFIFFSVPAKHSFTRNAKRDNLFNSRCNLSFEIITQKGQRKLLPKESSIKWKRKDQMRFLTGMWKDRWKNSAILLFSHIQKFLWVEKAAEMEKVIKQCIKDSLLMGLLKHYIKHFGFR